MGRACQVGLCTNDVYARDRCRSHYKQLLRSADGPLPKRVNLAALAYAAPTPRQLDERLAGRGGRTPDRLLTGAQLLDRVWGREAARA